MGRGEGPSLLCSFCLSVRKIPTIQTPLHAKKPLVRASPTFRPPSAALSPSLSVHTPAPLHSRTRHDQISHPPRLSNRVGCGEGQSLGPLRRRFRHPPRVLLALGARLMRRSRWIGASRGRNPKCRVQIRGPRLRRLRAVASSPMMHLPRRARSIRTGFCGRGWCWCWWWKKRIGGVVECCGR